MPPAAGLIPFVLNKLKGTKRDGAVPWDPLQGCARALGTGTVGLEDPAGGCHHPREGPGLGWEGKSRGKREKEKGKEGAKWPESQEGSLSSASSCSIPSKPAAPPGPEPLGDEAGAPHSLLTAASPPPSCGCSSPCPLPGLGTPSAGHRKLIKKRKRRKIFPIILPLRLAAPLGAGTLAGDAPRASLAPGGCGVVLSTHAHI